MSYIKALKPQVNGRFKQGYYQPMNKIKYIADNKTVIYRSSLELKFCQYCDLDPTVLKWISEPDFMHIQYINPFTKRLSTYYPDFYVQFKTATGVINAIIELKADSMISLPKDGNVSKLSNYMKKNILINQIKKRAAEQACAKKDMKYLVITEKSEFFKT